MMTSERGHVSLALGSVGTGGDKSVDELYSNSQFCLILPGHVYDLGRRAYDAMARACILVIVALEADVRRRTLCLADALG